MAIVIKTNGTLIEVNPEDNSSYTFEEVKRHIEIELSSSIQIVSYRDDWTTHYMLMDEDGIANERPVNPIASYIIDGQVLGPVHGNVLVCNMEEIS